MNSPANFMVHMHRETTGFTLLEEVNFEVNSEVSDGFVDNQKQSYSPVDAERITRFKRGIFQSDSSHFAHDSRGSIGSNQSYSFHFIPVRVFPLHHPSSRKLESKFRKPITRCALQTHSSIHQINQSIRNPSDRKSRKQATLPKRHKRDIKHTDRKQGNNPIHPSKGEASK